MMSKSLMTWSGVAISLFSFAACLQRQPTAIHRLEGTLAEQDLAMLDDIAIGVHTSGYGGSGERIQALKSTWLKYFKNHIIMGEAGDEALGISAVPSKYYCALPNNYGNMDTRDGQHVWAARGRCTQMRFLYVLLTVRENFPNKSYYGLMDDDIWVNPQGFTRAALHLDAHKVWMLGAAALSPKMVYGGALILSGAAVSQMSPTNVMTWASQWEHACSGHGCCDVMAKPCFDQANYTEHFNKCHNKLVSSCAHLTQYDKFAICRSQLERQDRDRCTFGNTRPEFPVPMYYFDKAWDTNHGDDHVLSFMVRDRLKGQVITEDRIRWNKQQPLPSNLCWGGLQIIAQHHIGTGEIYQWEHLWQSGTSSCQQVLKHSAQMK